jgi:hypothetical protein
MNFKEIAEARQSCRKYNPDRAVEESKLQAILDLNGTDVNGKNKRIKEVKSRIKEAFHVSGIIYPRWVQEAEWPLSASGKPMKFVGQKRKKGKEYEGMLYTLFYFEDVDTGEERVVEQFT